MLGSWFKNPENSIFLPLRLFLHQSGCFYLLFSDLSALGSSLWGQCGHLMSWYLRPVPSRWRPSSGPCGAKAQGEDPAPIQRGKDAPERMLPSLCGCSQRTSHERKFTVSRQLLRSSIPLYPSICCFQVLLLLIELL